VLWDINFNCNHRCVFCYNNCRNHNFSTLSTEKLENIAEQLIKNEVVSVTLGGGEPLLEKDVVFRLGHLLKGKAWLVLATNGSLIDSNLARRLSGIFSAIQVSLHGAGDELDRLVGVRGAFRKTMDGIKALADAGFDRIEICFVLTRMNRHLFEPMAEKLISLDSVRRIRVQNFIPSGTGYINKELLFLKPGEVDETIARYKKILESMGDKIAFIYDDAADEIAELGKGDKPNPFLHILPDGSVGVFPHIPVIIGNLLHEPLGSIWESKGAGFFMLGGIREMLRRVTCNNDIGFFETCGIRPWIDKPMVI
jgi:MoaA/NifB/PqqE/SkfB family radical SAM enzyme